MLCVNVTTIKGVDTIVVDTVNLPPNCLYEVLTPIESNNIANQLALLYEQYFGFDVALFALIVVSVLSIFAVGFCAGAMWKVWSKVF